MTAFRLIILASGGVFAAAFGAVAADLPVRSSAPYIPQESYSPVASWQGLYAGVHAGGGFGRVGPANTSGVIGGVHGGYNAQFGQVVVGGEADLTASDVHNKGFGESSRQPWTSTLRARAGYIVGNNVMAYGTGGLAVGNHTYRNAFGKTDSTDVGYVLGAGAEMQVQPNVTLRGEYLYYSFSGTDYPAGPGSVGSVDTHTNVLRAGASYKF